MALKFFLEYSRAPLTLENSLGNKKRLSIDTYYEGPIIICSRSQKTLSNDLELCTIYVDNKTPGEVLRKLLGRKRSLLVIRQPRASWHWVNPLSVRDDLAVAAFLAASQRDLGLGLVHPQVLDFL